MSKMLTKCFQTVPSAVCCLWVFKGLQAVCLICVIVLSHPFNIRLSLCLCGFVKTLCIRRLACPASLTFILNLWQSFVRLPSVSHMTPIKGLFCFSLYLSAFFRVSFLCVSCWFWDVHPLGCLFYICLFSTGLCDGNDGPAAPEERCKSPTSGKDAISRV